ncbi:MAG: TetR/AcrR family transcriptional regulator [Psychrobacter sp.]|jgi:AcrR family transcriptional regulator|uniref:TetR/AcrR family transcriptional regulator n=1 Tax=Psychrobacter namhaensis TaxID=292734 RepID=A0ABW8LDH8_9GAMM|nr:MULTISPECIES: TetR/AcrR family transcriptional regulator [Psychrobacter]MCD6252070.1 TetR/AcrR family transcriptional regulator [Psychrobacter sp.]HCN17709.1 TetR family transcriptional regulator [Psychrobacter sp.]|tara:strand:+ start:252 stop:827 length:576 start_codon:yes stop_codon:yes gene_type:complete
MEMENAYKRKKQPEVIRRALLDQAARITLEQGLSKVTFQAVADAVGVTKGGVMHHFATKNALILEVFNDAMAKFEAEVDAAMAKDPVRYGSFTRAYIDATISLGEKGQKEFDNQATLYVLMLGDSEMRELWAQWANEQLKKHEATDNTETLCMVRLVADGIWLSDFSGINISDKKSLRARLLQMTQRDFDQ